MSIARKFPRSSTSTLSIHHYNPTSTPLLLPTTPHSFISSLLLSLSSLVSPRSFPHSRSFIMRFIKITKLSPKRLFGPKKTRSDLSQSDPLSFGSGSTSGSSSDGSTSADKHNSSAAEWPTPKSVLPPRLSGEWSDMSTDLNFDPAALHKVVSKKELAALLSRLGDEPPSQAETEMMFKEVGLGFREEEEHVNVEELLDRVGSGSEAEEMREAFDFFDTDHDGRITAEELLTAFAVMGDKTCTLEDCRRMIAEVDKNRDGFVCYEDFTRMMQLQI